MRKKLLMREFRPTNMVVVLRNILMMLVMMLVTASCNLSSLLNNGDDDEDEIVTPPEETVGTATGKFTLDGKTFTDIANVGNMSYNGTMDGNSFSLQIMNGTDPEVVVGSGTDGSILFLYRGTLSPDSPFEMNETTTAAALLSLLPSLWALDPTEYPQFETKVKALGSFPKLVEAVKNSISKRRSVFNTEDEAIISAVKACYAELLAQYSSQTSNAPVAKVASKSDAIADSEDTRPIEFSPEANSVSVRTQGWGPIYECTVDHEGQRTSQLIYPHSSYSLGDLAAVLMAPFSDNLYGESLSDKYKNVWDYASHGDWVQFDLSDTGDYQFMLEKDTPNATHAMCVAAGSDLYSTLSGKILEKKLKDNTTLSEADREMIEFWGEQLNVLAIYIVNPENRTDKETFVQGFHDVCETISQNVVMKSSELEYDGERVGDFLKEVNELAEATSFVVNAWARNVMWYNCPSKIDKCFSQHHMSISDCSGVGIYLKSGGGQNGEPGKQLSQPLKFGVRCHVGQGIRLEVVSGNGTLDRYSKTIYQPNGDEEEVEINWTLGDKDGEQIVRAWIEDVDTHEKQGLSVTATAFVSKGTLLSSIGGYINMSYDNQNRLTKLVDRTCMMADPDPSEIITTRYVYDKDNPQKLTKMVITSQEENSEFYDIQYNDAGYVKSLKWKSTGYGETDYGDGKINYDKDGHIIRLISSADGETTTINCTWENGNLVKIQYVDPYADEGETSVLNYYIAYGNQKNEHKQFTMTNVGLMDLMNLFYTGQFGCASDYLPTSFMVTDSDSDGTSKMNLNYSVRPDGYIARESVLYIAPTQGRIDLDYSYVEASSGAKVAVSPNVAPRNAAVKKMLKKLRLFGLH